VLIGKAFESRALGFDVGNHLSSYAGSNQAKQLITEQTNAALPAEYWIAEERDSGSIIAMSGIYRFWWTSKTCLWLGWFCVSPEIQHHGLGSAVVKQTMSIARARGATIFKVETDKSNPAAQFYEKHGFVREAILSGHYAGDEDALVLSRSLTDVQSSDLQELYKLEL
jgi:GNAT superfamily N-acetyltransferase